MPPPGQPVEPGTETFINGCQPHGKLLLDSTYTYKHLSFQIPSENPS